MADSVAARDSPLLGGFARQSAELQTISYSISQLKSRVFQHSETLSAILFHFHGNDNLLDARCSCRCTECSITVARRSSKTSPTPARLRERFGLGAEVFRPR